MKRIRVMGVASLILTLSIGIKGCALLENELGNFESAKKGREAFIQTYDEESNIIDLIEGSSIDISRDTKFDTEKSNSSVINITVGGKEMVHVGSSLIMYEKGLENQFEKFAKTVDVKNFDRSTPFLNRMVNNWDNITTGKGKVVLVRSQSGKPLATFAGDKVSYFATGVDKSTGIMIDGKYLFIYKCDYSIYDMELLR